MCVREDLRGSITTVRLDKQLVSPLFALKSKTAVVARGGATPSQYGSFVKRAPKQAVVGVIAA
jgi:hypothetical protein